MKVGLGLGLCTALMASSAPAWSQTIGQSPLSALHQALHLTPQQEIEWKAYRARAATPNAAQDRRRAAAQMFPNLTAPQRLDLVQAEMKQELADLGQQAQALKTFYAALTPEQRSIFDAQTLPQNSQQQQPGQ